jgi:hypothetical protein
MQPEREVKPILEEYLPGGQLPEHSAEVSPSSAPYVPTGQLRQSSSVTPPRRSLNLPVCLFVCLFVCFDRSIV